MIKGNGTKNMILNKLLFLFGILIKIMISMLVSIFPPYIKDLGGLPTNSSDSQLRLSFQTEASSNKNKQNE